MREIVKVHVVLTMIVTGLIVSLTTWPSLAEGQMPQTGQVPVPVAASQTLYPQAGPAPVCAPPVPRESLATTMADGVWCATSVLITLPFQIVYHFFKDLKDVSCAP